MHKLLPMFAVLLLSLVGNAHAQRTLAVAPAAANEQRQALIIGNAAYKESPLRNPVNDATDMAAELRKMGFAVTLRTNSGPREMRAAIREFSQSLKNGGVGLFYFAGHGVQAKGRNYLIPVNADIREEFELEDEAVDANRVLAGMEEAGNRVNIVILDACRNNPFARSWRSAASGLAQMSAPAGSFVAFATAPGSVAADGSGRNGLFTENLLRSLREPDTDIDRVFTRVTAGVARTTGNKQVPWKSSSLTGEFRFRSGEVVTSAALGPQTIPADPAGNDRAVWESVKDSRNPEEIKAYLEQFPKGLFAGVAIARLRALQAPAVPPPSASGLTFQSIKDGSGPSPSATDTVRVHYRGTFMDGSEFDSSYQRGRPAEFALNRVIKCWTEGVQRMKVGGKASLTCPPALAYGASGAGGVIPPNATLKFEIELLDVSRN